MPDGRATAAASRRGRAAARTRPGHNTPLLVLYGSNLGTAEELATRVADLAEVNGFATRLAPLDDFVGKLPDQGGVLIFCASYNGAPPDNATQFVKWLGGDLPKDAFPKCATRCSAAATATGPRPISRSRVSSTSNWPHMARAASMRAARAMPAAISTANSRAGLPSSRRWRRRNSASNSVSAAAPRMSRFTGSSRWRRRRSMRSWRSAVPRR